MIKEDYFFSIQVPEKEEYSKYMLHKHFQNIAKDNGRLLLKVFDEIEQWIIHNGKFYENIDCYEIGKDLKCSKIYFKDINSGVDKEIEILKLLTWNKTISSIYEIRIDSKHHVYRLLLFPYSQKNKVVVPPFVIITYSFDKMNTNGNRVTNELRDSSERIKVSFSDDEEIKRYLMITERNG